MPLRPAGLVQGHAVGVLAREPAERAERPAGAEQRVTAHVDVGRRIAGSRLARRVRPQPGGQCHRADGDAHARADETCRGDRVGERGQVLHQRRVVGCVHLRAEPEADRVEPLGRGRPPVDVREELVAAARERDVPERRPERSARPCERLGLGHGSRGRELVLPLQHEHARDGDIGRAEQRGEPRERRVVPLFERERELELGAEPRAVGEGHGELVLPAGLVGAHCDAQLARCRERDQVGIARVERPRRRCGRARVQAAGARSQHRRARRPDLPLQASRRCLPAVRGRAGGSAGPARHPSARAPRGASRSS